MLTIYQTKPMYVNYPSNKLREGSQKKTVILWSLTITGGGGQPEPYPLLQNSIVF